MGAFGDRLRREREMRGITLEEITESTKISRRHLEALEGEHFDQLPGGVFNKGFVRAYARFLGIDGDQAVADYAAASHEQPEPEDKFPLEIHQEHKSDLNPRRSHLPLVFAIAALVGVLVGYAFWVKSRPHTNESAAGSTQPAPASAAATTAPPVNVPTVPTVPTPAAAQAPQASETTAASSPSQPAQAAPEKPVKPEKAFVVQVTAKEDSWVSIVADGKSVMERVLTAEKKKKIKAGKTLVLRTGNAGGIEVTFNGVSLGSLGNENEPRTLTFNANGLVQ